MWDMPSAGGRGELTVFSSGNAAGLFSSKRSWRVKVGEKSINRWKKVSDNDILQYIYVRDQPLDGSSYCFQEQGKRTLGARIRE